MSPTSRIESRTSLEVVKMTFSNGSLPSFFRDFRDFTIKKGTLGIGKGKMSYNKFQYPTGNFPSSTEFWKFFPNSPKISNSGIPVSFLELRRDGKWPVPNGGTETRPGKRMFQNMRYGKWHLGIQTSTCAG